MFTENNAIRFFEVLAKIISNKYGVNVTVKDIKKVDVPNLPSNEHLQSQSHM